MPLEVTDNLLLLVQRSVIALYVVAVEVLTHVVNLTLFVIAVHIGRVLGEVFCIIWNEKIVFFLSRV